MVTRSALVRKFRLLPLLSTFRCDIVYFLSITNIIVLSYLAVVVLLFFQPELTPSFRTMGDSEPSTPLGKVSKETDAMSRQESMDKFNALDNTIRQMFGMIRDMANNQQQVSASGNSAGLSQSVSGMSVDNVNPPPESQEHPASAPSFLKVISPPQCSSLPAQGPSMVLDNPTCPVDIEPINMVPQSAANTQVACSVSTAVQPVPGYLVSKIQAGQYVDFNLLRPNNLKKLPTEEPSQFQLSKLLRSDLQSITTFADWSEAWAVYVGVLAKDATANISSLISYFLLLSTASRDVPGSGWLEYDAAFRKQVVNNPAENWGEVIPTLWMTTVLSQGSLKNSIREGNSMTASKSSLPCFKWNDGECTMARCRYAHNVCSVCRGAHKKKNCQTQVPRLPPAVSESNFSGGPAPQGSRKRAHPK